MEPQPRPAASDLGDQGLSDGRARWPSDFVLWHTFTFDGSATTWSAILGYNRRAERVDAMPGGDPVISEVVHVYALRITLRAIVAARISEIADKLFFLRVYDVARCEGCTHTVIGYNSCRNRHCPKCHSNLPSIKKMVESIR
jgi:hypothetical protein